MELTPALKQFLEIKKQYPKSILFFRMGDFYECFFEDAKITSEILNITLTKRGKTSKIPLAGIPYHALNTYLKKMVNAGKTVTIIEQIEDPKLAKGRIVKRDVVRTVTPGTIFEDDFLDSKTNNYLLSLFKNKNIGYSFLDLSTGQFYVGKTNDNNLIADLTKINPVEILIPDSFDLSIKDTIFKIFNVQINEQPFIYYNKSFGEEKIKEHFNVISLKSFGIEQEEEIISSVGALLQYIEYTQKSKLKNVSKISFFDNSKYMGLDIHTIKNLELVLNLENTKQNTLMSVLDYCKTPMGGRLLKKNILLPLTDQLEINKRLNILEKIINDTHYVFLEEQLSKIIDLERLSSKIMYNLANPRDLLTLKYSLLAIKPLQEYVNNNLEDLQFDFSEKLLTLCDLLDSAIIEDCPTNYKENNFIKKSFSNELDELLNIKTNFKNILINIELKEKEKTGIKTLRIGYNKIFGFYFEIPKSQINELPNYFIRKQTLANNERVITEELKNLENSVLGAEEKAKNLELEIFNKIILEVKENISEIYYLAQKIAEIDFYNSLAIVSSKYHYVKPNLIKEDKITIQKGRHPVLERINQEKFISNDLFISAKDRTHIITGPNMAGKSTYMRQNALILIMAQMGSFVPCEYMEFKPIDKLFTRIGANDNLALGLSTFMVEMIETANILNNCTKNSFILLDEIGRGTSTYDGMSIAWAVLEYIHNKIASKTLFATHYHQLTDLENKYDGIVNYHISAKEIDGNIIFLRKLELGPISKSYGIEVAKLAGLPQEVINNAKEIEKTLDINNSNKDSPILIQKNKATIVQKTLF